MSTWYIHEWECVDCGYTVRKKSTRDHMPKPCVSGCKENTTSMRRPHTFGEAVVTKLD